MDYWMCSECNYVFEVETSPETCIKCHKKCDFDNVTCYVPECGGPGNVDCHLIQAKLAEHRAKGRET